MTMSITIKSTHKLRIGDMTHDLTTEELIELRDQIDSALAARRWPSLQDWYQHQNVRPLNDWSIPPVTSKDNAKLWSGVHTSQCGPVNAAQTHIQP
jgi:hypothetical protein